MGATCCAAAGPLLEAASLEATPVLGPPQGVQVPVKVLRVYDGDTVTLAFCCGGGVYRDSCRLRGIDAPEMKPRMNSPTRDAEKTAAIASRDALASKLGAGPTRAVFHGREKFGRWLVSLYVPGETEDVGAWMVRQRHAVPYDGGSKAPFQSRQAE